MSEHSSSTDSPLHVLLIQGNGKSVQALRHQLVSFPLQSFQVDWVADLGEALAWLNLHDAAVILLELSLPKTHAPDAFITLHLQVPHTPIVAFTETSDPAWHRELVRAGAQASLTRTEVESPLVGRELVHAIERHAIRTETHSHAEQLQFSEARFRLLINENADGIVVVNQEGIIRFLNPAAATMFGKSRETLVGSSFRAPLQGKTMIELARAQEKLTVQMRVVKTIWDSEDVYLATLRDVTTQQQIADALQASQERYREFMELSSEGIWRCHLVHPISIHAPLEEQVRRIPQELYIDECNTAMAEMYGFKRPDEMIGRFTFQYRLSDDPVNVESHRTFVRNRYRATDVELHEYDRHGAVKVFRNNIYGIVENDLLVGAWGTQRDETAQHKAVQELASIQAKEKHQRQLAQALADSAAALNSTLSFEQVVDRILENIGRVVPHDAASVFLIENENIYFVRGRGFDAYSLGDWNPDLRMPLKEFKHFVEMCETRRALVMPSTEKDARWVHLGLDWVKSYVGAPLCVRDNVIGFVNVDSVTPNFYNETHAADLQAFADQAATALDNARLHSQAEQRAQEWAMVYELTRELSMQHDLDALLRTLVERSRSLLHAANGGLALYDAMAHHLVVTVIQGKGSAEPGKRMELGQGLVGRVALTREPLIVDDYPNWEGRTDKAMDPLTTAGVAVPMLFGGELVGVLSMREVGATTRRFTQDDVKLLSLIAAQAAALMHNARLNEETKKRAQQLALVYDAGLTLNRELEPHVQLNFLLQIAQRSVHADRAAFFRYDAAAAELVLDLTLGYEGGDVAYDGRIRVPLSAAPGIEAWVARERVPVLLSDTALDVRFAPTTETLSSGIWVPVEHDKRLLGVLGVGCTRTNAFTLDDERLLMLYASQAAVALENGRLYQSVLQENERRTILHWASQEVVSAGLDAERVYAAIHQAVSRLMSCEAFALAVLEEDGQNIRMPYLYDRGGRQPEVMIPRSKGLSGKVIDTGDALIIGNLASSKTESINVGYPVQVVSVLGVPMRHGGQVVGALLAESYVENAYDDSDRVRLEMLAAYAAAALTNVRGYENLRRALEQKTTD